MHFLVAIGLLVFSTLDDPKDMPDPDTRQAREKELRSLLVEYFNEKSKGGHPKWEYYAPRFMGLVERNPEDRAGFEGLFFIATQGEVENPEFQKAIDLLIQHHAQSGEMENFSQWLVSPLYFASASKSVERLLHAIIVRNPNRDVRAEALFGLVQFLKNKAELVRLLKQPEGDKLAQQLEDMWGRNYVQQLKRSDPDNLDKEADELFRQGHEEYRDIWESRPTFGKQAPEIEGEDIDGEPMRLSDYRGKVVVLNFWAFWCLPCRAMFPHERLLVERLEGKPFTLVGVNNDADRDEAQEMVDKENITWRSWWDGGETERRIARAWNVRVWPSIYILDHKGVLRYRNIRGEALDVAVATLLKEMETADNTK